MVTVWLKWVVMLQRAGNIYDGHIRGELHLECFILAWVIQVRATAGQVQHSTLHRGKPKLSILYNEHEVGICKAMRPLVVGHLAIFLALHHKELQQVILIICVRGEEFLEHIQIQDGLVIVRNVPNRDAVQQD